ncbi:hypothetical protein HY212_02560 [Candidatus Pacearchaeota archaeon]|nr:hypothetical protein [Candidatus Pacearchaeota archaeon]
MQFKKITLCQITSEEHARMLREGYNDTREAREIHDFARIVTPLIYQTYEELLDDFSRTPLSKVVTVNLYSNFIRYKAEEIAEKRREIADAAREDKLKRGNLKLTFGNGGNRTRIKFLERKEEIISYMLAFNSSSHHLFSWHGEQNFTKKRVSGVWSPETACISQRTA